LDDDNGGEHKPFDDGGDNSKSGEDEEASNFKKLLDELQS
jgi:hypothetical protein